MFEALFFFFFSGDVMYASKERKYRVQEKHPGIAMGLFQVFLS